MKLGLFLFKYFPYGGMQRDFLRIAHLLAQEYLVEVFTTAWQGEIPANITVNQLTVTGWTNHRRMQDFAKQALLKAKQRHCDLLIGFNKMPGLDIYFAADNCYVANAREKHGLFYRLTSRYRTYAALEQSVFVDQDKPIKILVLATRQKQAYQQIYRTAEEKFYLLPVEFNRLDDMPLGPQDARLSNGSCRLQAPYAPNKSHKGLSSATRSAFRSRIFKYGWYIPVDHHVVLMVCSAFKTKGVDRALKALSQLDPTLLAKTHLLVIGGERTEAWLQLVKRLKINAQVKFLGEQENVLDYMCAADIFLHPARQEAGGKVILEAMSCGLPVLTTADCGYAEHVSKAEAGVLLPQKNIDTLLAEALNFMLTHPDKRAVWRERALDYVASYPDADLAAETVTIIKDTINSYDRNR